MLGKTLVLAVQEYIYLKVREVGFPLNTEVTVAAKHIVQAMEASRLAKIVDWQPYQYHGPSLYKRECISGREGGQERVGVAPEYLEIVIYF